MSQSAPGVNRLKPLPQGRAVAVGAPAADGLATSGTSKRMSGTADIQVIARAADVLDALAGSSEGLSLAQIAQRVRLSRSTVHRIVLALIRQDFIRASDAGYRLGPALLRLADASRSSFQTDLQPHLVDLSQALQETVDLSVLTDQKMTFVYQVVAPRRLRAVSGIGISFPLHCTANGKAVLAALPPSSLDLLLPEKLQRFTSATHSQRESLLEELELIRSQGVAFDREEHTVGICAAGVALRSPDGEWHAVSTPLPAQRFYGQEDRLASALLSSCRKMVAVDGDAAEPARRHR